MNKLIHSRLLGLMISFTIGLLSISCGTNNNSMPESPSTEFASYIKAYTGNLITTGSNVLVEFSAIPENKETEDLISFKPSMDGSCTWTSETTLCFTPDEGEMDPGTTYTAELQLDKLFNITDNDLKEFIFGFRTAARQAIMTIDGLHIPYENPEEISVSGTLMLSEPVTSEDAARMLSIEYNGSDAKIQMDQSEKSDRHDFAITGLKAGEKKTTLTVNLNGRKAGFTSEQSEHVSIPRKGKFQVTSAEIIGTDEEHIEVRFSQPIGKMDDYSGLFTIAGAGRQIVEIKDNIARIFFERKNDDDLSLYISSYLKSESSDRLDEDFAKAFANTTPKPAAEIPLQGTLIPDVSSFVLPFRAVSLSAIDLKVIKIYENNILMFLQDNNLDESGDLRRSGRLIYKKTIRLDNDSALNLHKWNDFSVDLSGLIKHEPGAIYRVTLTFNQEYSLYGKKGNIQNPENSLVNISNGDLTEEEIDIWDTPNSYYYENYYDWDLYDWRERNDPTKPTYYMDSSKYPSCNLLSSNLGVIAKSTDSKKLWINVNDIMTTDPMEGAEVRAYNYQLQEIGRGITSKDGAAEIKVDGRPFVVVASKDGHKSYLKVESGKENSLSRFDTGGQKLEKGLKGFVYGERGVWRPGDDMFLTMILDDPEHSIPANHPVTLEVYTPQGQFHSKQVATSSEGGFYCFTVKTQESDPTGRWNAYFKVGGATFHKSLPVETIKPNRLKVELDVQADILVKNRYTRMDISSSWLTGPAASGLNARAEMTLKPQHGTFPGFDGFVFHNPETSFSCEPVELFNTRLDANGKALVRAYIPKAQNAPGMLTAHITTKVTEPGGDESIVSQSMPFSPFSAYVGVLLPETESHYETDKDHIFSIATVDMDGNRVSGHRIEYTIYKLDWSWWWDDNSYINSSSAKIHERGSFISGNANKNITFNLAYPDWGRFYILVKDVDSGHSCGKVFTADWPSWRGRADRGNPDALSMLTFTTDKTSYAVGEKCVVYIPAADGGNALVSLENGRGVISQQWVKTSGGSDTPYRFDITKDMAPNFYVHITLIQPHSNTKNGAPVRMYGVVPVLVSDASSVLSPVLSVPDVIRPQEEFEIKVSGKKGQKMTYTLAIVDEGLLDITSFRTPDPWGYMYAREALGVKTWDIYNDVAGAYAGNFASMFKVGGDQYIDITGKNRDNRFKPVVKFMGPFTTDGTRTHKVRLPMYVGSVRVMAVAGHDGAYGKADKAVPVRSPLMILPTAPRELSSGETVAIPVNVFAMEEGIRDVKVSIRAEGPAEVTSSASTGIRFDKAGDRLVRFEIKATGEGTARLTILAECNGYKATETINIQVNDQAGQRVESKRICLNGGETVNLEWNSGSEWAKFQAAGFPCIDYNGLYAFTTSYSHYCTEQICSRGLSLLYSMKMLEESKKDEIKSMIDELLQQLYSRQRPDGGFVYWPGAGGANLWCSAMAGHFMTIASQKGFQVSKGVYNNWKNFQKKTVKDYRHTGDTYQNDLVQAYGLYTLALCGAQDNGAMNRMKESGVMSPQAALMLSSAYSLCGKRQIARDMIENLTFDFSNYPSLNMTFGSALRDKALAVEAYTRADDLASALAIADEVAQELDLSGYTTQTAAFSAVALGVLSESVSTEAIQLEIKQKDTRQVKSVNAVGSWDLDASSGKAGITNKTDKTVVLSLSSCYRPSFGEKMPAHSSQLVMDVQYLDNSGNKINPESLKQGTEFTAVVKVTNNTINNYSNLALTIAIPSGWEIFNERLYNTESSTSMSAFTYNDIRDKASIFYFDLPKGQSKTFRTRMTAIYEGTFSLPSVSCEAMYDNSIYARSESGIVKVTR